MGQPRDVQYFPLSGFDPVSALGSVLHPFCCFMFPNDLDPGGDLFSPKAAAEGVVIIRNVFQFLVLTLHTLVSLVQRSTPLLESVVIPYQPFEVVFEVEIRK